MHCIENLLSFSHGNFLGNYHLLTVYFFLFVMFKFGAFGVFFS